MLENNHNRNNNNNITKPDLLPPQKAYIPPPTPPEFRPPNEHSINMPLSAHQSGVINTGNILNVNKKAGQKTAEELSDYLKVTLSEQPTVSKTGHVHRTGDDLAAKLSEHKRDEIKVGAKVFLNAFAPEHLNAAIEQLLRTLDVSSLDNLIVAYHPQVVAANGTPASNGIQQPANNNGAANKEGELSYSGAALVQLQQLWKVLERFAGAEQIGQLGIADLDTESLKQLHAGSAVKPTIAQINLSACCVVPPSLQEFCNANEIQLLTHSDPEGK